MITINHSALLAYYRALATAIQGKRGNTLRKMQKRRVAINLLVNSALSGTPWFFDMKCLLVEWCKLKKAGVVK